MSWFVPTPEQLDFLASWAGRRIIEPYCADCPLYRHLTYEWAIGIDKEPNSVPGVQRALVQDWMRTNMDTWRAADTIIMSYPPSCDVGRADLFAAREMAPGQRLILASPRPWGCLTVAGTEDFWRYLLMNFHLYGESPGTEHGDRFLYCFGKEEIPGSRPADEILDGHELFELGGVW